MSPRSLESSRWPGEPRRPRTWSSAQARSAERGHASSAGRLARPGHIDQVALRSRADSGRAIGMESQSAEAMVGVVAAPVGARGVARLFRPRLLALSLLLWLAFGVLTAVAATTAWLPGDLGVAQWIQSVWWGPLTSTFETISRLSGGPQIVMAVLTLIVVVVVNRRAAPFALVALADAILYDGVNSLVHKPRPIEGFVHVTEHAGAYAFPSGHATFVVTVVVVLLLCLGTRVGSRMVVTAAAALGAAVVLIVAIQRIFVGAHYPSDVLGGFLLASAWLSLLLSIRPLSDPVVRGGKPPVEV